MDYEFMDKLFDDFHTGCFGNYNAENILCKKHCTKNLSCVIERNRNADTDFLETMLMHDKTFMIIK